MSVPTVLLVEDDDDVRDWIADVLQDEGYAVACACDGTEALMMLRHGLQPHVILLDLLMAGMNGAQFRAEQRKDPGLARIPVVVLTADRQIDEKARNLDAAAYIRKPVAVEELVGVVRCVEAL